MTDLEDLELDSEARETRPFQRPLNQPPPAGRGRLWAIIAVVSVVVLAIGYVLFIREPAAPAAVTVVDEPAPPPPPASAPVQQTTSRYSFTDELPPLDASDEAVAKVVSALSSHPRLLTWLANPRLLRTFAVMIENVATNGNPAQHLRFLAPEEDFAIRNDGGAVRAAKANARRYDLATAVFNSFDPEGAAAAYEHLKPLIEDAFAELGYPRQAFEPSLEQAFANILAVEVPTNDPELEKDITTYRYADPRLESLSPLSKQLLRMGPSNARRVQAQVRRLADALGMDV